MTQKCETDRACDAAGPGDLSALPADIPENCTSVSQGQEAISLELQIAIEDVVVDAFGDMLDASVNMTVTAVEAGLGGDELQLLVAGLQKTADPLAAEADQNLQSSWERAMTTMHVVAFHGDTIEAIECDGVRYVAMKCIVENLGMAWEGQRPKLLEQRAKFNCQDIMSVAADGKERSMLCLPAEKLPLWLASINPAKIPGPAIREKVELYQSECAVALHDYWMKGHASRAGYEVEDPSTRALIAALVEQDRARKELAKHDERIRRVEARQDALDTAIEWSTVAGWTKRFKARSLSLLDASKFGLAAKKRAKEFGIKLGKTPDPRFGEVNVYPNSLLAVVWDDVFAGEAAHSGVEEESIH